MVSSSGVFSAPIRILIAVLVFSIASLAIFSRQRLMFDKGSRVDSNRHDEMSDLYLQLGKNKIEGSKTLIPHKGDPRD